LFLTLADWVNGVGRAFDVGDRDCVRVTQGSVVKSVTNQEMVVVWPAAVKLSGLAVAVTDR